MKCEGGWNGAISNKVGLNVTGGRLHVASKLCLSRRFVDRLRQDGVRQSKVGWDMGDMRARGEKYITPNAEKYYDEVGERR